MNIKLKIGHSEYTLEEAKTLYFELKKFFQAYETNVTPIKEESIPQWLMPAVICRPGDLSAS